VFFPVTDRSECISKFESEDRIPITLAVGDIRHHAKTEVVTIAQNGHLHVLSLPLGNHYGPAHIFSQIVYPNICSAQIMDIDGDGLCEMICTMTDRVIRSYRYSEEAIQMIPINKWEMPAQISGWSIGLGEPNFALFSQSDDDSDYFVRLELSGEMNISVIRTCTEKEVELPQMILPRKTHYAELLNSMVSSIAVANHDQDKEAELVNNGSDIVCITTATIRRTKGCMQAVATIEPLGEVMIYVWNESEAVCPEPVAKCKLLPDAQNMCSFSGCQKELQLLIGIVNGLNKVAVVLIDFSNIDLPFETFYANLQ